MSQILGSIVVFANGTFGGSGVNKVDHIATGKYHITFDFSVAGAIEIASIAQPGQTACITAYGVPAVGPNVVEVVMGIPVTEYPPVPGNPVIVPVYLDLTFQLLVVG